MSLKDAIFFAGIVGCGGAGFPTHVKLSGKAEYLIINGAECEPLLRTDRYIMKNLASEVVSACMLVKDEVGARDCFIALKETYSAEIAALKAAIADSRADVKLHELKSFYPAGDEQTLVCEVTGRAVPPAGIPLDVGCVVSNIATMLAVSDAAKGTPFTDKYLTVTGEVKNPTVIKAPVGTPLSECISLAGGALCEDYIVISGGPMMGKIFSKADALSSFVTKTTSGLIVLKTDSSIARRNEISVTHMLNRARSSCIQCSLCTQMCPRNLMGHPIEPHKIMRKTALSGSLEGMLDNADIKNAALCCECGVCETYACPMGLQPRRINSMIKKALAEAGIRYPKGDGASEIKSVREFRKIPTKRAAARAGVLKYYDYNINSCIDASPSEVCISLRQSIGAPSAPVVKSGDRVEKGTLIAQCPDGKLGANLHASISGMVTLTDNCIKISR